MTSFSDLSLHKLDLKDLPPGVTHDVDLGKIRFFKGGVEISLTKLLTLRRPLSNNSPDFTLPEPEAGVIGEPVTLKPGAKVLDTPEFVTSEDAGTEQIKTTVSLVKNEDKKEGEDDIRKKSGWFKENTVIYDRFHVSDLVAKNRNGLTCCVPADQTEAFQRMMRNKEPITLTFRLEDQIEGQLVSVYVD